MKTNTLKNPESPLQQVSVCMAVYDGESHLREQLDSLAQQTHLPGELVITDDGSTDETAAVIEEFALTAPFEVRYFRNPARLGYANNFLHAASLCRGELIGFCDQDDIWEADKIEICAREFVNAAIVLCVHSANLFGGSIQGKHRVPDFAKRHIYRPLEYYPLIGTCGFAMVFRRKLLEITSPTNRLVPSLQMEGPMAHDQWIWFLGTVFGEMVTVPQALVLYRQHEKNASGTKVQDEGEKRRQQFSIQDYTDRASREARAADFLERVADQGDEWQNNAQRGATFFRRCSSINLLRSRLYRENVSFVQRLYLFTKLLVSGAYSVGQTAAWLGLRALMKDFAIGVVRFAVR